jgi:hypothetical protein
MEDVGVEAAEKDSYADCPDSSTGPELKAVEEPALSEVEGSKTGLNRRGQIRVRGTCSCWFGILDHVGTGTSTRIRLASECFERPVIGSFSVTC